MIASYRNQPAFSDGRATLEDTLAAARAGASLTARLGLEVEERDARHRRYRELPADMARSGLFDIVGHMDLTKKFDQSPTIDLSAEIAAALDAITASDMAVEVDTAGTEGLHEEAAPTRRRKEGAAGGLDGSGKYGFWVGFRMRS